MPISSIYKARFKFNSFYHVYNRSVDGQLLFYNDSNYRRFLSKYKYYLSDIMNLYAYALIPNHFHFLCSIKPENKCQFTVKELNQLNRGTVVVDDIVVNRFRKFFLSHSLNLKSLFGIKTNVFAQKFKHIEVEVDNYFTALMYYIHFNPVKHRLTDNYRNYPWSSFEDIFRHSNSLLEVDFVYKWFGTSQNFERNHVIQFQQFEEQLDFLSIDRLFD